MAEEEKNIQEELKAKEQKALSKLKEIRQNVSEDDTVPVGALTLRKILGGDFLSAELVRHNIWPLVLVVFFTVVYVAKYKALSSSSTLTERCRESQVLKVLRESHDSLLRISDQPPYIINIPEQGFLSGGEE